MVYDDEAYQQAEKSEEQSSILDVEYVQQLIDNLPEGYKMVFLLYAIEGYKHHENSGNVANIRGYFKITIVQGSENAAGEFKTTRND